MNPFIRDPSEYKRDIDIHSAYKREMAHGLARISGYSFEQCYRHIEKVTSENGRLAYKDPRVLFVGRNKYGDREKKQTTFLKYLSTVAKNRLIMSPSMTVYLHPDQKRSLSSIYIAENVKLRKVAKKQMFEAKIQGDKDRSEYKNNEQQTRKIKANALSGAHCSDSTILYHHTIHSTLTSTCRSASGYGNAHNERLISGNRHYWSPDVVTANILSVINHCDLELIEQVVEKYALIYPSTEQTMECIRYSTDCYWINDRRMKNIERLVDSLKPVERAAFVYVGDFYHIGKYNEDMARKFLFDLSHREEEHIDDIENPKSYLDPLTEEMGVLVSLLCMEQMRGSDLSSIDELDERNQKIIAATARHLYQKVNEYADFIKAFFVTDAMPPTVAHLPQILRRCAVTSDTDSTIYTVQHWIEWYAGQPSFEDSARRIGHVVSFLSSASIVHILAQMSANMGVRESQLFQYTMKSEFYFPVFALTSRAKTYFASIAAQEGQIFRENDHEIKGAVLKGSNSPQFVIDGADQLLKDVLARVERGEKISLLDVLKRVSSYEWMIRDSIEGGRIDFYKKGEIKPADSYKLDKSRSPYFYYELWETVFAPKYGSTQQPPYESIKVTLDIGNKTDFKAWLDKMDAGMSETLVSFLASRSKTDLGMIQIPKRVAELGGVPSEIIEAVNTRSIIAEIMEPYYVILETLGYYSMDGRNLRLVSDRYPVDDFYWQNKQ